MVPIEMKYLQWLKVFQFPFEVLQPLQVVEKVHLVTGVITSSLFCEDVSSDNMGNKEFSVGIFSFKEGTNLIRFPTVEDVREVFFLYHMNIIPMAITHMPTDINRAKMSLGDNENG